MPIASMDDVAVVMRANLPNGMTPKEFGQVMGWGTGTASARQRIASLTADELRQAGITVELRITGRTPMMQLFDLLRKIQAPLEEPS